MNELVREYHYLGGNLKRRTFYFNGELLKHEKWYLGGQLEEICTYRNGKIDECKSWHENGNIRQHLSVFENWRKTKAWYEDGNLFFKNLYFNDLLEGKYET